MPIELGTGPCWARKIKAIGEEARLVRNTGSENPVANAARKAAQEQQRGAARKQGEAQERAAWAAGRGKRSI